MTNAELLDLLRETRGTLRDFAENFDCDSDAHKYGTTCRACDAAKQRDRIDAALAEPLDSATPVVEWRPADQRVFLDGVSLRVVLHTDGLWLWSVYWPLSHRTEQGRVATEEEAKSAAIAAAKGN